MAKGFYGGGGNPNMQQLIRQAQKMQTDMARVQESLSEITVEAAAGGGVVKVLCTADKRLQSITIAPEAVDPDDVDMLQDLVLAAVNEGLRLAGERADQEIAKVTGRPGGLGGLL